MARGAFGQLSRLTEHEPDLRHGWNSASPDRLLGLCSIGDPYELTAFHDYNRQTHQRNAPSAAHYRLRGEARAAHRDEITIAACPCASRQELSCPARAQARRL